MQMGYLDLEGTGGTGIDTVTQTCLQKKIKRSPELVVDQGQGAYNVKMS